MSEQIAQPISERATEITPDEEICLKFLANELQAILAGRKMEVLRNEELEKYKAKYQEYVDFSNGIDREKIMQKIQAEKPQQYEYAKLVRWAREEVEEDEEWVKRTFEVREDGMIIAKNSLFLGGLKTVTTLPVNLIEVRGDLKLADTKIESLNLPNLKSLAGHLETESGSVNLPLLENVYGGMYFSVAKKIYLPNLKSNFGLIVFKEAKDIDLPIFESSVGNIESKMAEKFSAPVLKKVLDIVLTRDNIKDENKDIVVSDELRANNISWK